MHYSLLGKMFNQIFPSSCAICEQTLLGGEEAVCSDCFLTLPVTNTWTHPYDNEMAKIFWHLIPLERCCSLFYYHSHAPSSQLLYRLKYGQEPDLGYRLGRLIAQKGKEIQFFEEIDGIIPIPLSSARLRSRGYNQSLMIAEGIASATNISILYDVVKRTSFAESQTHKNKWQRNENVEHVFELTDAYPVAQLVGKHLLLVDDVCTTGATIVSCCKTLMSLGGMKFSVATVGWAKFTV